MTTCYSRARKTRARKTRARKTKARKTRARKTRARKTRRVYRGGSVPAPFGTWVGNGFGKGGTGYNDWQRNIHEQAVIPKFIE